MPLSPGDKLGPYEVLALLGEGGMGEVYRARDPRLGREVALKFLHAKHSDRLEREARAIAALSHPHICAIFDVGPNYLVMEHIEGAPLKGPLPQAEAMRYAVQIAQALEAAHAKGIIHRDLKPANILVTTSGVKLLDFGLAKLTTPDDSDDTRTIAGTVMGTAAYMSPEQAQGQPADARSDMFSFGAVLYEMLSGRRAFSSSTAVATMAAVLHKEPEPLDAPPALQNIVSRCLRKSPADRFQSVTDLRAALEKASATPGDKMPSIAVLPFANMSRDADDEYFSDGLAEEIINLLAHIPGLKVIARTSAFAFRGKEQDIRGIAETLGVGHVLEGSVRRAGNRVRVTAQLINAGDGAHLWSERYDRELTDIFAIQDEIAQAITAALKVTLTVSPARERYQPKLPAYEAYLKARHHWAKVTPESLARSKEYYEQAIAFDPVFALAYVGLADYFLLLAAGVTLIPAHQAMPLIKDLTAKALAIEPSFPEAHAMAGIVAGVYDYNWKECETRFRMAMSRDPVSPQVRQWYGYFCLISLGRFDEAIEELNRAVQEDLLNTISRVQLAIGLWLAGRYEDQLRESQRLVELDENFWYGHFLLAINYGSEGRYPEALASAEKAYSIAPWSKMVTQGYAVALLHNGNTSRAEEIIQELRDAPEAYGAPRNLGLYDLHCGHLDSAADWFEKAIAQRDPAMPQLAHSSWLRSLPRWPALAKMMNLPRT